ncbi:cupin domain-containing protein [Pseudoxanthomonas sp.]|uniref:cupin domain-containing protein n=1 Tax=Pseudoxanthomonas sp. TaxID=1871049 RepID=UPI00263633E3|nr:cupin domain-containing protein [Pseudoxanthomonas sp.]WDS36984.1 MAG: cupin domain-containing protein [Pseudoxanthomonas sp.]
MRTVSLSLLCLSALLSSGASVAHDTARHDAGHDNTPLPIVTPVMTRTLPDYPGKEAQMITVEYPPGAADPVHRHNANGFIYVLDGSIVMGVKGGEEVTLTAGQSFYEGPDDIHTVGRNASMDKPARFLVLLLKDAGKPAVIPVP